MSTYEEEARGIMRHAGPDAAVRAQDGGYLLDLAVEAATDKTECEEPEYRGAMEPVYRLASALLRLGAAAERMPDSAVTEQMELYRMAHDGAVEVVQRMMDAARKEDE